jgi:uroporphyrinogen decarboxylase
MGHAMRHSDRVHAALLRKPVDRVPIWMWFHPAVAARLATHLEIPLQRVADAMGDDIRQTWIGNNHAMEGILHEREGDSHTDFWGIEWVREGYFNQVRRSPLADADESAIRRYEFPFDRADDLLANMEAVIAARDGHFIGCDISPCLLEVLFRIRGMEATLLDLAASPKIADLLLGKAADFAIFMAGEACRRYRLDWLWTGDDVGGQQAMIINPRRWRESIRPHLAGIFAVGKGKNLPVAYHCCGAIRPIIPDLIEIGLDVLNPIQSNCPGMDPLSLKKEYGNHLTFMGGVDTQELLPRGTAAEVFRDTRALIEGMTLDGGGYILAASHSVPPETPLENIFAMYAAAGESWSAIMDRAAAIRAEQ